MLGLLVLAIRSSSLKVAGRMAPLRGVVDAAHALGHGHDLAGDVVQLEQMDARFAWEGERGVQKAKTRGGSGRN